MTNSLLSLVVALGCAVTCLTVPSDAAAQKSAPRPAPTDGKPKTGDRRITVSVKGGSSIELVLLDPGTFSMGSTVKPDEGPVRTITLTRGYYMATTEISQAVFTAIMGKNPSQYDGPSLPAERVTWTEATEFARRLSASTGKKFRLPTEAEWEYACLGGNAGPYGFGSDPNKLSTHAWYEVNAKAMTHPVAGKTPNAWGLHDMQGNVWEWCSDWFAEGPAATAATDPTGPATGTNRVLKGGSYGAAVGSCRCANRFSFDPNERFVASGVRVVMDIGR